MALVLGHFALAQLHHGGNHLVHLGESGGINDFGAPDIEANLLGGRLDLIGVAHQHGGQEGTGQQTGGSLQNAGIGALGEDDLAGMGFELLNQEFKHERFLQKIGFWSESYWLSSGQLKNENLCAKIYKNFSPLASYFLLLWKMVYTKTVTAAPG